MAVHVVTDSTADLSPALLEAYGVPGSVHVVPLTIHFGDTEYQDGVDLTPEQFYEMLKSATTMPHTSQPSPAAFVDLYNRISSPDDTILSFHLSSRVSGTYQSALLAARQFSDRKIEVVDTRTASLGLGLITLHAAVGVAAGVPTADVLREARVMISGCRILFLVDTLEFLQRNGRIGKAQAMVGGLLNMKPILHLDDGVVAPLDKVRGTAKARARLLERLPEMVPPEKAWTGAIMHASSPEAAGTLREAVHELYPSCALVEAELGPTVGTHVGPGTLAVTLFVK